MLYLSNARTLRIHTISFKGTDVLNHVNGAGIGVSARVAVIETVDISHEKEEIGVNHGSRNGGKSVIVTELDFGNSKSIVFIDNGNNTNIKELIKSILSVDITSALRRRQVSVKSPGNVRNRRVAGGDNSRLQYHSW